jgi:hypothetical protein
LLFRQLGARIRHEYGADEGDCCGLVTYIQHSLRELQVQLTVLVFGNTEHSELALHPRARLGLHDG